MAFRCPESSVPTPCCSPASPLTPQDLARPVVDDLVAPVSTLDQQNEDPWTLSPRGPLSPAHSECGGPAPSWMPLGSCSAPCVWSVDSSHTHTLATTHNVIHQVTGGPDHKQADQRRKEREPGQCGDLRDALWRPDVTSSTLPSSFRPDPSTVTSRPPPWAFPDCRC